LSDVPGIVWGLFTLVSWGVADFLARDLAVRVGGLSAAFLVVGLGALMPLGLLAVDAGTGSMATVDWATFAWAAPLTGTLLGAAYAVYYTGLQRGSVAVVTGVGSGWLVVSVLIAVLAFGEALTAAQTLAIVLMLGGVALISTQRTVASGGASGLGWGVLAMLTLGGALAMWKPLTEAAGPAMSVLVVRLIAAGSLYVYFRARGGRPRLPLGSGTWRILATAAALDGAGFVAYNIGLDGAPLTVIAPLAAAHPLATIALAAVLLRERLTLAQGAGVGLTVSAVMALSVLVA